MKPFTRILLSVWIFLTLLIVWSELYMLSDFPAKGKPVEPGATNYLIIAPQQLKDSASAWADYRTMTGFQTRVFLLAQDQVKISVIRNLIQKTYAESGRPYPFYVLLIGHAHPSSSFPETFLPAANFSVDPNLFSGYGTDPIASDDAFAAAFSSGIPRKTLPIFIGRIPVRTEEEAFLLLERTRKYEETPPIGGGRTQVELISSNAGFGSEYDPILEWALKTLIQKILPNNYRWNLLSGDATSPYSYPIDLFPQEVAKRFNIGALALVYIGHGQPDLLGWAYATNGERNRIFSVEDAALIQDANDSIGIFTACSAGAYALEGDNLSVVEAIYLTKGGPVATYSSSAWINGLLNGRLVIDIFDALLVDKAVTMGEWVDRVEEVGLHPIPSQQALPSFLKAFIPNLSGVYEKRLLLSPTQARQILDIQHATYNLFGDPALQIAYPQPGLEVYPDWLWLSMKGKLAFHGESILDVGQPVSVSLEIIPGNVSSRVKHFLGTSEGYSQANHSVIGTAFTDIQNGGDFSGTITLPPDIQSGKYLLRAVAIDDSTYASTHPVYVGWLPLKEIFSSKNIWWSLISLLLLTKTPAFLMWRDHCNTARNDILSLAG